MNIEQLKKDVKSIETSLNDLKKNIANLSEKDKIKQSEELKNKVEETKKKINNKILELSEKTDDNSKKELEEARQLLESLEKIVELQREIINGQKNASKDTNEDADKHKNSWKEKLEVDWEIWWKKELEQEQEDKSIFWKAWDRTKEQRNDVRDKEKRKDESLKNALRTTWFVATWVWAVALIWKWIKKVWDWAFWDDEDEENENEETEKKSKKKKEKKESSWWKKFLVGAWITAWTVVGWVEIYKHWNRISSRFKEKLWLALSFDESIKKVEAEVRNWKVDDDHFWVFNAHFEWITYDEKTQEICSYWQKTKIEKEWKKLHWKDIEKVEFASREELIHAANIVNFSKRMLRWRWASSTPFCPTERWGDIAFNCSARWKEEFLSASNSNEWTWILGSLWTVWWWILWWYCAWVKWAAIWAVWGWVWWYASWAYIDNTSTAWSCCETICRWRNFDLFINYLNDQKDENWKSLWESAWEQRVNPDETPVNWLVDNWREWWEWSGIIEEIENAYWEDQTWRRNLKIERDEKNPKEYTISSYSHKLKMTIEWWPTKKWEKIDYSKIKKIHIEKYEEYDSRWDWLDIDFPHTEEWLKEAIKTANLTNMIVEDRKWKWWEAYPFFWWRYSTPPSLDMDVDWFRWKTILSRDAAKKFPTLFEDLRKWSDWWFWTALWINNSYQTEMHDRAVHDKPEWSQYIKFLHQIGKWHFRKN